LATGILPEGPQKKFFKNQFLILSTNKLIHKDDSKVKGFDIHGIVQFKKMEERTLKNVNHYLNTNIYSYLETSGG
jgi:hypothetical protein